MTRHARPQLLAWLVVLSMLAGSPEGVAQADAPSPSSSAPTPSMPVRVD